MDPETELKTLLFSDCGVYVLLTRPDQKMLWINRNQGGADSDNTNNKKSLTLKIVFFIFMDLKLRGCWLNC